MAAKDAKTIKSAILTWIKANPGIIACREEGLVLHLRELYSAKELQLRLAELIDFENKTNSVSPEQNYLVLLFENHSQLVLCQEGFAFPPDFQNTGQLALPNPVYCMKDIEYFFATLRHLVQEPERKKESLEMIFILIALLDGARKVGLSLDVESRELDAMLYLLEAQ